MFTSSSLSLPSQVSLKVVQIHHFHRESHLLNIKDNYQVNMDEVKNLAEGAMSGNQGGGNQQGGGQQQGGGGMGGMEDKVLDQGEISSSHSPSIPFRPCTFINMCAICAMYPLKYP